MNDIEIGIVRMVDYKNEIGIVCERFEPNFKRLIFDFDESLHVGDIIIFEKEYSFDKNRKQIVYCKKYWKLENYKSKIVDSIIHNHTNDTVEGLSILRIPKEVLIWSFPEVLDIYAKRESIELDKLINERHTYLSTFNITEEINNYEINLIKKTSGTIIGKDEWANVFYKSNNLNNCFYNEYDSYMADLLPKINKHCFSTGGYLPSESMLENYKTEEKDVIEMKKLEKVIKYKAEMLYNSDEHREIYFKAIYNARSAIKNRIFEKAREELFLKISMSLLEHDNYYWKKRFRIL